MRAALALLLVTLAPAPALAAQECEGHKVTISYEDPGVGSRIQGTPGPDVIQGGPASETIIGGAGDDVVCGGAGQDRIDGGPGRDELYGQAGNDTFVGSSGSGPLSEDIVAGGTEFDTADYRASPVGVRVDTPAHVVLGTGASVRGGIQSIEQVYGSQQDDTLIANRFTRDVAAVAGDDLVVAGEGTEALTGGAGDDTLSYASARERVVVDLADEHVTGGGREDLVGGFETVIGSKFDDSFKATDDNDHFVGGPGDDTLRGGKGDDILEGGPGSDTFYPGPGDDHVDGGPNEPVTNQNHPGDLVSYAHDQINAGDVQFEAYLTPDPHFGTPPGTPSVGNDVFAGIESVRGVADRANNIIGDDGPNVLIGGSHTDDLNGLGGDDLVFGLAGPDDLEGGAGDDFLSGGAPPKNQDKIDGGDGDDTCLNTRPDISIDCETLSR